MNMWTYIIGVPIFCGYQVGQSELCMHEHFPLLVSIPRLLVKVYCDAYSARAGPEQAVSGWSGKYAN